MPFWAMKSWCQHSFVWEVNLFTNAREVFKRKAENKYWKLLKNDIFHRKKIFFLEKKHLVGISKVQKVCFRKLEKKTIDIDIFQFIWILHSSGKRTNKNDDDDDEDEE